MLPQWAKFIVSRLRKPVAVDEPENVGDAVHSRGQGVNEEQWDKNDIAFMEKKAAEYRLHPWLDGSSKNTDETGFTPPPDAAATSDNLPQDTASTPDGGQGPPLESATDGKDAYRAVPGLSSPAGSVTTSLQGELFGADAHEYTKYEESEEIPDLPAEWGPSDVSLPDDDFTGGSKTFDGLSSEGEEEFPFGDEAQNIIPDDLPFDAIAGNEPIAFVDTDGAQIGWYGKAERLAQQTLVATGLDQEAAWPVLVDIYLESPWPRTRFAVEQLVAAGADINQLSLATEIRRIWRSHPEFARRRSTLARGHWWQQESAHAVLSWPCATKLAGAYSSYPDIEEVEHVLETLFEHWAESYSTIQESFPSFSYFIWYVLENLAVPMDEWLACFVERDNAWQDPFDRLESITMWPYTKSAMDRYGIDFPNPKRFTRYRPSGPGDYRG